MLIGCNSGQGVDIQITADKPLTSAELWLAYDYCHIDDQTKCDSIGWPGVKDRLSGTVFTLGDDEKVFHADVVGGIAQIHLDAIPDANKPLAIGIVGYSGTDVVGAKLLQDVEIPLHDQARWEVALNDASGTPTTDTMADPTKTSVPGTNAYVWDRQKSATLTDPTGYAGCLAFQKWTGAMWETWYFVPKSDTDCDGDPPDCNPYWYNAPVNSAKCVSQNSNTLPPNVCAVGAMTCRSETEDDKCVPQVAPMICVGSAVCSACEGSSDLATCLKNQLISATPLQPAVPTQVCKMFVTDTGPCINTTATTPGWTQRFVVPGMCAPPGIGTETAQIRALTMPFSGGGASAVLSNGATVNVHASGTSSGCIVDVTYTAGVPPAGAVGVVLAVFYGAAHEILVPIVFDFAPPPGGLCSNGGNQVTCEARGPWPMPVMGGPGDSMFGCAI